MILKVKQTPPSVETQIHFGDGLLYSAASLKIVSELKGQVVVISDSHLKTLIVDPWITWLKSQGISILQFTFSAGEESKTRETKKELEDQLFACKCSKDTAIIAIGGGVTTDLVGYLASTFCRGVPFLSVPTTLLGMVDAVVGGKTGVNTPFGKNLIGSFYPPKHIFIDTATLCSLPEREWRSGIAEVIKHGLIRSSELFHRLVAEHSLWSERNPKFLQEVIHDSVLIKKEVVEADFQEIGCRRILNFGHTVGHAIELLEEYQISHGEAVGIGMLSEAMFSHRLGFLSLKAYTQIKQILNMYQFPLTVSDHVTVPSLCAAMALDKKATATKPRFVLLDAIGSTIAFDGAYCTTVDDSILYEVLDWTLSYLRGRS